MSKNSSGLVGGTLCGGMMPACGSTTVFILMEVTHDSMKSIKSRANRAAHAVAAHRTGKTPGLLPRFPNRGLHTHSPRPSMTNPHCAALKTAVAATTRPSLAGPPYLVSTVGNHFVITLPPVLISSLQGGPVTQQRRRCRWGCGKRLWYSCGDAAAPVRFSKSGICSCAKETVDSAAARSYSRPASSLQSGSASLRSIATRRKM